VIEFVDKIKKTEVEIMGLLAGLYEPEKNKLYPPGEMGANGAEEAYLRAVYDYEILAETHNIKSAFQGWAEQGIRSFIDLLPVESPENLEAECGPSSCDSLWGRPEILYKNEQTLQNGTVFDRVAVLLIGLALESGAEGITGVFRDWKLIKAFDKNISKKGIRAKVFAPQNVVGSVYEPENLILKKLSVPTSEAFKRSRQIEADNFYNVTPGYNPYSREAYKTIAYEIFLQQGRVPERIYLPIGEGDVISGIWEGFEELRIIGWSKSQPKIFAILSPGDEARARWLERALDKEKQTVNSELSDSGRGMFDLHFAAQALQRSGGGIVKISREELRRAEQESAFAATGQTVSAEFHAAYNVENNEKAESVVFVDTGKEMVRERK